ncbi:hypothetical protein BJY04DRAFT_215695 [Aspergillus karnatakaensis]|uniref:uncharacterized protein n=1 Tax=Aspergillus karnatakaensis TaxID=1810916 RepID=UPI003CCD7DAF
MPSVTDSDTPDRIDIALPYHFTRCMLCGCDTRGNHAVFTDCIRVLYEWHGTVILSDPYSLRRRHVGPEEEDMNPGARIRWDHLSNIRIMCSESGPAKLVIFHVECWPFFVRCFAGTDVVGMRKTGREREEELDLEVIFDAFWKLARPGIPVNDPGKYPYRRPTIEKLSKWAKPFPASRVSVAEASNATDCFGRLSLELREQIAILLYTHDFLTLRLASRAMAGIFDDNHFWKSRFSRDGERGFYRHLVTRAAADAARKGEPVPVNWRMLYQACTQLGSRTQFTIQVWEVIQWIKDYVRASNGSVAEPLEFAGRALQSYSNDCCIPGQRVERAMISPNLAKIAISIVSGPMLFWGSWVGPRGRPRLSEWAKPRESATRIVGIEFIDKDGSRVVLGVRYSKAKKRSAKSLRKELEEYQYGNTALGCPFDGHGVRVLVDATAESLRGFRLRRSWEGISSMNVLRNRMAHPRSLPKLFGFHFIDDRELELEMKRVVEVIATFQGEDLFDLGIKGHHLQGENVEHWHRRYYWGSGKAG